MGNKKRLPHAHLRVCDLPRQMRPRERLYREGAAALTERELVAILLRTGSPRENVLALADRVLAACGGLYGLNDVVFEELASLPGIGPAKAAQVLAAVELGKRVTAAPRQKNMDLVQVHTVADIAALLMPEMAHLDREHFRMVLLDVRNRIIGIRTVSIGSLTSAIVHPREFFKEPLKRSAFAVVMVHNHPSGDPQPSAQDLELTERLCRAGFLLGIQVWDHLILGRAQFFSFREHGLLAQTQAG